MEITVEAWTQKARDLVAAKLKEITSELHQEVIMGTGDGALPGTPVLTGRARGNWYASLSTPSSSWNWDGYDKDGSSTVAKAKLVATTWDPFKVPEIYLTNNIHYIRDLEYGFSSKAPQGMARIAIVNIAAKYK